MNIEILEKLIEENISTHEMSKRLNCSQTNIMYWLRKFKLSIKKANNLKCEVCHNTLQGNQRKFCSNNCKSKYNFKNRNGSFVQTNRGLERKKELINLRGGGCEKCGYKRCIAALDFHHNKGIKHFRLDMRTLSNTSMKRILEEFKMCEVLCSNCHREEHYCSLGETRTLM